MVWIGRRAGQARLGQGFQIEKEWRWSLVLVRPSNQDPQIPIKPPTRLGSEEQTLKVKIQMINFKYKDTKTSFGLATPGTQTGKSTHWLMVNQPHAYNSHCQLAIIYIQRCCAKICTQCHPRHCMHVPQKSGHLFGACLGGLCLHGQL